MEAQKIEQYDWYRMKIQGKEDAWPMQTMLQKITLQGSDQIAILASAKNCQTD